MQGYNMGRYRPYDADPRKESFNQRTGTHALGKRARKLDSEGALIVRFELPFNVWCDACQAHIGQGVRYNAEKRKVDAYYSTPIFAFRCKKACCQTWMEIRTDPKHSRYVIVEGARQQTKEWDPEENGGFPVLDDGTQGSLAVVSEKDPSADDPFSKVEKAAKQKQAAVSRSSRLEELHEASTARADDPYTLNVRLRSHFRQEKKQRLQKEAKDEELRRRIGWHSDLPLLTDAADREAHDAERAQFLHARDAAAGLGRARISTPFKDSGQTRKSQSSKRAQAASSLAARVIATSKRKRNPFETTSSR